MKSRIRFGVAGNPPNFWKSKYRSNRVNSPEWLRGIGLDALELQYTYGVKIKKETALLFRERAKEFDIELSVHAPYYVVLASQDKEKIKRSIQRILKSFQAAEWLNSKKVIFHPGFAGENREESLLRLIKNIRQIENLTEHKGIYLYPEIGGKVKQLGSLEDIITICQETSITRPCIDFGHLYARENGSLKTKKDFSKIFEKIKNKLGFQELKNLHCHFYPVKYNQVGEVVHRAFHNQEAGPRIEPFIDAVIDYNLTPTIICEAKNSQDIGAMLMKSYYLKAKN